LINHEIALQKHIFVPGVTSAIELEGLCRKYSARFGGRYVVNAVLGLEVVMSSIRRLARATTTWLTGAGLRNDLTTLSDRDLRDLGLVREQIGKNCKLFVLT
jgi:uncharacterized protein YjiS (DUF1127 family)